MAGFSIRPCGDFRTTYGQDTRIFDTTYIRNAAILGIFAVAMIPFVLDGYYVNLFIQISYFAIAALGLNILVGFTGFDAGNNLSAMCNIGIITGIFDDTRSCPTVAYYLRCQGERRRITAWQADRHWVGKATC